MMNRADVKELLKAESHDISPVDTEETSVGGSKQDPWYVFETDDAVGVRTRRSDVAWTRHKRHGFVAGSRPRAADVANAHLIAAARELYDVASAPKITLVGRDWCFALEIPGRGFWAVKLPDEMRPFFQVWDAARRAAIAKAEGR